MHAKRLILITSAAAVLAVPGVASAHHGKGDGGDGRADGKRHGGQHGHHHRGHHRNVVSGVVTARDASAKTVTITLAAKTRKSGIRHRTGTSAPTSVTLDVSDAKVRAADTDGDGTKDELEDVRVGDTVAAWVKGSCKKRGDAATATAKARFLVDKTTTTSSTKRR